MLRFAKFKIHPVASLSGSRRSGGSAAVVAVDRLGLGRVPAVMELSGGAALRLSIDRLHRGSGGRGGLSPGWWSWRWSFPADRRRVLCRLTSGGGCLSLRLS